MNEKFKDIKKFGKQLSLNEMQKASGGKAKGNALLAGIGTYKSLQKLLKKFR